MGNLKKLSKVVSLLLISCLLLSGCWGGIRAITDRAFIYIIGFDKGDKPGTIKMTVQIPVPGSMSKEGGGGEPVAVFSGQGKDVTGALEDIQDKVDRELFIGFTSVLVFSADLAKEGIGQYTDYFLRSKRVNTTISMVVAKGSAESFVKAKTKLESVPGRFLQVLLVENLFVGKNIRTDLGKFEVALLNKGMDPILPVINMQGEDIIAKDNAVFKRDRMIGILTPVESYGATWILGTIRGRTLQIPCPPEAGGGYLGCRIVKGDSATHAVVLKNGQLAMEVKVSLDVNLVEKTCRQPFSPILIKEIEKGVTKQINKEVQAAARAAQHKYNSDFLGYGAEIAEHFPKLWDSADKEALVKNVPTVVKAKIQVSDSTGRA